MEHELSVTRKATDSSYLGSSRQSVTRFTDANVETQFANAQIAHRVLGLVFLDLL